VSYDLNKIAEQDLRTQIEQCLTQQESQSSVLESNTTHIPVYYGLEVGLDLERLLARKKI
jgi:Allophanate hydrolase subunit 1.